ncbi:hypothetical protein BDDG_13749, partial [Blastomyces dermatitidis ATCC 18188]
SKCAFCARDHKTSKHKYETCSKRDEICQYTLLKYSNYKEKHASNEAQSQSRTEEKSQI